MSDIKRPCERCGFETAHLTTIRGYERVRSMLPDQPDQRVCDSCYEYLTEDDESVLTY